MERTDDLTTNVPRRWSALSYAGEPRVPAGIAPRAGSWPVYFMARDTDGVFVDRKGNPITFAIRQPDSYDFDAQLSVVKATLGNLTPEQIVIARYWSEGPTSNQWVPIVTALINAYHIGTPRAERIWAAVQTVVHDTLAITWHFKYLWDVARPNQLDQSLETVLPTPKHPTYPAGHATVAGCYQQVLSYFFAPKSERLRQLAEECAISRLYAGVHFPADLEQGLRLGRQIGGLAVAHLAEQHDSDFAAIDYPLTEDLQTNLPPPPYQQATSLPGA